MHMFSSTTLEVVNLLIAPKKVSILLVHTQVAPCQIVMVKTFETCWHTKFRMYRMPVQGSLRIDQWLCVKKLNELLAEQGCLHVLWRPHQVSALDAGPCHRLGLKGPGVSGDPRNPNTHPKAFGFLAMGSLSANLVLDTSFAAVQKVAQQKQGTLKETTPKEEAQMVCFLKGSQFNMPSSFTSVFF